MDHIEPVEDPNVHQEHLGAQSSTEASTLRPPGTTLRPPTPSNRTRRPSIRISRLSSISSLDTVNAQQHHEAPPERQPAPSAGRQSPVRSDVQKYEDHAFQGGRRRSSSEPRPGRWSSPSPDVLTRVTRPKRMMSLTEESSHQSPVATTPPAVLKGEQHAPELLEPAPAALEPTQTLSMLRRTSQAAINRFTRNRASTVTGAPPADDQRASEYGPHVVDVLDVIGKTPS